MQAVMMSQTHHTQHPSGAFMHQMIRPEVSIASGLQPVKSTPYYLVACKFKFGNKLFRCQLYISLRFKNLFQYTFQVFAIVFEIKHFLVVAIPFTAFQIL